MRVGEHGYNVGEVVELAEVDDRGRPHVFDIDGHVLMLDDGEWEPLGYDPYADAPAPCSPETSRAILDGILRPLLLALVAGLAFILGVLVGRVLR